MNRTIAYCTILAFVTLCTIVSSLKPDYLNDKNSFLKNFINHELVNILGVILAITLASTASIHLAFNRIEERHNAPNTLTKSRQNLRKATYWLIGLFIGGVAVVVIKPIASDPNSVAEAMFNSAGLLVLLWQVLILVLLTQLVFMIEPEFPPSSNDNEP